MDDNLNRCKYCAMWFATVSGLKSHYDRGMCQHESHNT